MARRKLRESESLHNGFAEDFAAEIERDTWEKGQQAGRWLSQHLYSEREKREMEQKRRRARAGERKAEAGRPGVKAAEAAQTEAGRGGGAQSTAHAAQSAPEGTQKRTPTTGVSAQQDAAWQAAGQDGQAAAEQGAQGGTAAETDWHTPFSEMEFAPSLQANQDALDSLKPVTQSIATKLENVSAQLNGLRTMNPMYITNIAEHNQSRQALEEQQAALSEQLKQAQAAEQTMRQAYQEATKTPADLLCEQYQNQRQAVAQARKDGLSQAEIAQLEAQMNETYQSYLAAWNEENQAQRQAQEQQQQQNLQSLGESARHGSLAQQAQAAILVARRTPGTSPEEIQRLERTLESEEALAEQARQDEQEARQAAQAQQTAASSQTQQQLDALNEQIWQLESANMIYDANASGMAYSQEYLDLLSEREQLIAQLDAQKEQELQQVQSTMSWGTLEAWAQPDYVLSETEKAAVNAALEEWNGMIGPDFDAYYEAARALRDMGQSTQEIEILLYQAEIMDTLATKVSGVRSAFSGAGNALPLVPQIRGALEAENWRRAGFEGTNPLGVARRSQSAAAQNPVPYALGYGLSSAAQYALAGRLMQAVPGVSGALDDVANAIAATGPAQKLQAVPVLGQLATPGAIRSMASDALLDFGLGTVPQMIEQAGTYARQLTQGVRPGEQVLTPGSIWGGALQSTGAGLLANAAGELAPAALRAVSDAWNGRPVLNAMQQQGLEAIQQGAAPSMAQQQALHSLWETSPGYVPANMGAVDGALGMGVADNIPGAGAADDILGAAKAAPQSAAEAAQRQAFAKWTQGEAMTAQEKAFVEDLWNTDPAKASEYWAAGEFLSTEAPGTFPLDGSSFDGTMKAKAEASLTGQRTPFDYLQDGKGWEAPPAGPDDVIRDGSHMSNGKLRPNVKYQAGEFEYIYQTDEMARIYHVEAAELHLTERVKRLLHKRNTPGKRKGTDHAGHLIADIFGGSPELDNLVSQLAKVNQSEYRRIEIQWQKALRRNQHVSVDIEVLYQGSSMRPSGFQLNYSIGNKKWQKTIKN